MRKLDSFIKESLRLNMAGGSMFPGVSGLSNLLLALSEKSWNHTPSPMVWRYPQVSPLPLVLEAFILTMPSTQMPPTSMGFDSVKRGNWMGNPQNTIQSTQGPNFLYLGTENTLGPYDLMLRLMLVLVDFLLSMSSSCCFPLSWQDMISRQKMERGLRIGNLEYVHFLICLRKSCLGVDRVKRLVSDMYAFTLF